MLQPRKFLPLFATGLAITATAFEVPFSDVDYNSQTCTGMWGGSVPFINVSFDAASQGQLAMVIYEWGDYEMLGKVTSMTEEGLPKTYVCTSDAVRSSLCTTDNLGKFIIDLPAGKSLNNTSFWTARVGFQSSSTDSRTRQDSGDATNTGTGVLWYQDPIHYPVRKTGFYCVAIVPVTVLNDEAKLMPRNNFDGKLAASEYPKVNFYFSMFLVYSILAAAWAYLCFKHKEELLPLQHYLSSLVGLLVIEMVANWAYYRYLNAHGKGTTATVFLIVVAILDAGRNALSFFMLLVVALGLSVVRESLGKTMLKCQLLAGAHFIFGVLYAIGIVELELESTSALILLLFVIPLAFTLSAFLLWIMFALNRTIAQLAARKQRFKLGMFTRLHRILMTVVLIVAIFFVVTTLSFSNRLAEDFAANTWKIRWWLLDGWLALLYFVSFAAICYIWRPTGHNRRLAMSDELAQEDEDAEDYDLEALESRTHARDDDDDDGATLVGSHRPAAAVGEDSVVFEIGDQDLSDDDEPKSADKSHHTERADDIERQGLINGGDQRKRDD